MNITIVCTHLGHARGGAEINDLHLGAEFEQLGHEVTYTFQIDEKSDPLELDHCNKPVSCPYLYSVSYNIPNPFGKILRHLNQEYFVRELKKERAELLRKSDLILTTGRPILTRLKSVTATPVFHAVRGAVNSNYYSYLKRADGLVFWGGCEESYESPGMFGVPYVTLDPGVNTELFYNYSNLSMENSSKEEDVPKLIFVGRLEPVKRIDRILEAVATFQKEGKSIQFIVIGDGSQRNELEKMAKTLDIADSVEFVGRVPHEKVPDHLNDSDVFVMSSRMENHPIALKEALACGTYAIAPNKGRIGEILEETSFGHLYTPANGESLTAALREVIESEAYRIKPETGTPQIAGWRENAEAILDMYRAL